MNVQWTPTSNEQYALVDQIISDYIPPQTDNDQSPMSMFLFI